MVPLLPSPESLRGKLPGGASWLQQPKQGVWDAQRTFYFCIPLSAVLTGSGTASLVTASLLYLFFSCISSFPFSHPHFTTFFLFIHFSPNSTLHKGERKNTCGATILFFAIIPVNFIAYPLYPFPHPTYASPTSISSSVQSPQIFIYTRMPHSYLVHSQH